MRKEVIIALIVSLLILFGMWQFNSLKKISENTNKECVKDYDCVPSTCCHSSSCVAMNMKPDCSEAFCSQDCENGTLDCGQGRCGCVDNKCLAVLK